jgi:hypothetical protein
VLDTRSPLLRLIHAVATWSREPAANMEPFGRQLAVAAALALFIFLVVLLIDVLLPAMRAAY